MSNEKIDTLCSYLEQEISWIDELNALLAEEKEYLETRQFKQLEDCASKKQELSEKLDASARERMALLQVVGQNAHEALKEFLHDGTEQERDRVYALNNKLAEHLIRCRELNTVNGQVIANNLYVRQEIMNALSGNKTDVASVYNAHGNLTSANDKKHHQKA